MPESTQLCLCCEQAFDPHEMVYSQENGLCIPCFQTGYLVDELTGEFISADDSIQATHILPGGREITVITSRDNVTLVEDSIQFYTPSAIEALFFTCVGCDQCFTMDLVATRRDGNYCEECAPPEARIVFRDAEPPVVSEEFDECKSHRCYGIEIEVQYGFEASATNNTVFASKEDGSLHHQGVEFCSPILQGDAGLSELADILQVCNDNGAEIDHKCGLHVHIDLRDFNKQELVRLFYILRKVEHVTRLLVTEERNNNEFCCATLCQVQTNDQDRFDEQVIENCENMQRYSAYNFLSYYNRKTVEVRLHHGTLNYEEIRNWVLLHLAIVDYAKNNDTTTFETLQNLNVAGTFEMLKNMGIQSEVIDYYVARLEQLGNTHLVQQHVVVA